MKYKEAFEYIAQQVETELAKSGFQRQKTNAAGGKELAALFTSDNVAYSVVYEIPKQLMTLRSCSMTDEGPDNDWKTLATWLYDEAVNDKKDAESIANDFVDGVSGTRAIKRAKQVKQKKKKTDDGSADPKFLAKRFVTYFPELKEEIKSEEDCYYPFRGATFAKEHIAPKLAAYLEGSSAKETEKIAGLFNLQYTNGDFDTRSVITIVILNSLNEQQYEKLSEYFDDDLKPAADAARKYIGKTVKPEVPKKKTTSKASTLSNS